MDGRRTHLDRGRRRKLARNHEPITTRVGAKQLVFVGQLIASTVDGLNGQFGIGDVFSQMRNMRILG